MTSRSRWYRISSGAAAMARFLMEDVLPTCERAGLKLVTATTDNGPEFGRAFGEACGKAPVACEDTPGFVVNRLLFPLLFDAVRMLERTGLAADDIDACMTLGAGHPMGPLRLADFIGLDTCLAIMEVLYDGFADGKYRPSPLLRKMVAAGYLGRKSGRGFYDYS